MPDVDLTPDLVCQLLNVGLVAVTLAELRYVLLLMRIVDSRVAQGTLVSGRCVATLREAAA